MMLLPMFLSLLGAIVPNPGQANTVIIETRSDPGSLIGTELFVDNEFAGFLGDAITLSKGTHELSFKGQYQYYFKLILEVTKDDVQARGHRAHRWESCIDNAVDRHTVSDWPLPKVSAPESESTPSWKVSVVDPVYVLNPGPESGCQTESSFIKMKQLGKAELQLSSLPPGAVVYINGKEQGKTDIQLVVPFFEREKKIAVVMRKPGYINCSRILVLPLSEKVHVECPLQKAARAPAKP